MIQIKPIILANGIATLLKITDFGGVEIPQTNNITTTILLLKELEELTRMKKYSTLFAVRIEITIEEWNEWIKDEDFIVLCINKANEQLEKGFKITLA